MVHFFPASLGCTSGQLTARASIICTEVLCSQPTRLTKIADNSKVHGLHDHRSTSIITPNLPHGNYGLHCQLVHSSVCHDRLPRLSMASKIQVNSSFRQNVRRSLSVPSERRKDWRTSCTASPATAPLPQGLPDSAQATPLPGRHPS